jgi:3-oxoacyl-[acyl-carrier protein] reductase
MSLQGKVALITGSSRGIGAATAKLLAARGAAVAVNYFQHKQAADGVVMEIIDHGGKAIAIQADAREAAQVQAMVERAEAELGPIDILVLNAGMKVPHKMFMDMTHEEFEGKVMGELNCCFQPVKAVAPSMIERKRGCIIGISSGLSRYASDNFSAHTAAKSALDGLMKALAYELGPYGIRVNTVAPGLTMTDATSWMPPEHIAAQASRTPLRRVGMPEDVAGMVLALAMDETSFVTGAYIPVSGGNQMI